MFQRLYTSLVDLVIPPRRTERTVSTLTVEDLQMLAHEDGLPYRDPLVRDLIWEIKYYANRHAARIAGEYLADELLALASEELGAPLLIPVPMHSSRRRERGHNQTEVLCEAALYFLSGNKSDQQNESKIGSKNSLEVPPQRGSEDFFDGDFAFVPLEYRKDVLKRVIDTPHQQGLQRSKRLKNVENSMVASGVTGRVCVVVDDVTTTGATLSEAKRALLQAGARRVHCVALARS